MKHIIIISALTLCLSAFSVAATAQNVTIQKQGGVGHVYEMEQVDSVVYFPIGDTEQFPSPETENTTTLWDIIKAQPNLKKFAAILEAATYYSDKAKPTDLCFSQILEGSTPLNVYAPSDAAISDAHYTQLLGLASTDGWKLQQEFISNHISAQELFHADVDDVITMLNGKLFKGNAINVLSTNGEAAAGNLHVLSSILPYTPNMKEYLLELAPDCSQARQFLAATDMAYLDLGKSVSVPSMDGSIQILDSVFTHRSPIMEPIFIDDDLMQVKGFGADLANERASYSMVMPTDQVWDDAKAKLAPHYRYSSVYDDKVKGDMGTSSRLTIDNPDSLSALAVEAGILVPLLGKTSSQKTMLSNGTAYSETTWPVPTSEYMPDIEVEIEHSGYKTTTYREADGYTIYDMTNNATIPELEAQIQTMDVFYNTSGGKYRVGSGTTCLPFDNDKFAEITDMYGRVSNNNFYYLAAPGATYGPRAEIKLQGKNGEQVMSGKYDIQVVVVPAWYRYMTEVDASYEIMNSQYNPECYVTYYKVGSIPAEWRDPETGQISSQVIDSIANFSKQKFRAQVSYNNNAFKDKTSSYVINTYDGLRVDTITVAKDFEFPYSYKNIRSSYPTLYLECNTSKSDVNNGFIYELYIDKIILRSKENGSVTEVTP